METGVILFEIVKSAKSSSSDSVAPIAPPEDTSSITSVTSDRFANSGRFVRYQFSPNFLKLKTVGAT